MSFSHLFSITSQSIIFYYIFGKLFVLRLFRFTALRHSQWYDDFQPRTILVSDHFGLGPFWFLDDIHTKQRRAVLLSEKSIKIVLVHPIACSEVCSYHRF